MMPHRLAAVLLALLPLLAFAEQRIGVVDMERLFREYYKSRIAEEAMRQQGEAVRRYLAGMKHESEQLQAEARRCGTNALNPALSATERENARKMAAQAVAAVRAKQAEMELYSAERSEEMRKLQLHKRAEILKEIRELVRRRAAAEGFQFVLDNTRLGGDQSIVIVQPAGVDITESVLRDLNRSATKTAAGPQSTKEK